MRYHHKIDPGAVVTTVLLIAMGCVCAANSVRDDTDAHRFSSSAHREPPHVYADIVVPRPKASLVTGSTQQALAALGERICAPVVGAPGQSAARGANPFVGVPAHWVHAGPNIPGAFSKQSPYRMTCTYSRQM